MKKSIVFSLIILLVLCVSPIIAGGGPPSPTEATRPADGTPDDTNEGSSWTDPDDVMPDEFGENQLLIEADSGDDDNSSFIENIVSFILPSINLEPIESGISL